MDKEIAEILTLIKDWNTPEKEKLIFKIQEAILANLHNKINEMIDSHNKLWEIINSLIPKSSKRIDGGGLIRR